MESGCKKQPPLISFSIFPPSLAVMETAGVGPTDPGPPATILVPAVTTVEAETVILQGFHIELCFFNVIMEV